MVRCILIAATTLLALGMEITPGEAAIVSVSYDFTASGFGLGAPIDPVTGSFSVTFDNTQDYTDATAGLTASINLPVGQIGFDYSILDNSFVLGGLINGALGIMIGTNDFLFPINNIASAPEADFLAYGTGGIGYGSSSVVFTAVAVPEPMTLSLLGGGIVAFGRVRRKRFKVDRGAAIDFQGHWRRLREMPRGRLLRLIRQKVGVGFGRVNRRLGLRL